MLKKILIILLPLTILIGGLIAYIYFHDTEVWQKLIENREYDHIQLQYKTLQNNLKHITSDLIALSEHHELKNIINNRNGNFDPLDLINDYINFSKRKAMYDQIRFIDKNGYEKIRINYNKGQPSQVMEEQLQNKSNRYYFKEAIILNQGEIFISPFDLNMEKGKIEEPLKPMIRFAIPVFDSQLTKQGIVILNYLGFKLIKDFNEISNSSTGNFSLLNSNGYWLISNNKENEWGFMIRERSEIQFQKQYPEAWEKISNSDSGQFYIDKGLFTFKTVYPYWEVYSSDPILREKITPQSALSYKNKMRWIILSQVSSDILYQKSYDLLINLLELFALFIGLSIISSWIIARANYRREKVERALKKSEEDIRTIVKTVGEGIIVINSSSKICFLNEELCSIFGYSEKELLNKPLELLIPQDVRQTHLNGMKNFLAHGKGANLGKRLEKYALHKNGNIFPIELRIETTQFIDDDLYFIGAISDITERKKTEDQIKSLNKELRLQVTKLETANKELEAISYSLSHDLRPPIRSISSFSQIILEDYKDKLNEDGKDCLCRIIKASKRLAILLDETQKLLNVIRNELNIEDVNLSEIAKEIANNYYNHPSKRKVEFIIEDNLCVVGDKSLIKMMLENLIHNAWKFTSKQENPTIKLGHLTDKGKEIYFLEDNGFGFDMTYADKLFKEFQQLHKQDDLDDPGTGIGLSIVQRIVNLHNGTIWAESVPNQGATFYFSFDVRPTLSNESKQLA